jgi:hypothetical protein
LVKTIHKIDWNSEETAALLTDLGLEVEVVEKYQSIRRLRRYSSRTLVFLILMPTD